MDIIARAIEEVSRVTPESTRDTASRRQVIDQLRERVFGRFPVVPRDFDEAYAFAVISYGIIRPKAVSAFFGRTEIRRACRRSFDEDNPSILKKAVSQSIADSPIADDLHGVVIDWERELQPFAEAVRRILRHVSALPESPTQQELEESCKELDASLTFLHEGMPRMSAAMKAPRLESVSAAPPDMAAPVEEGTRVYPVWYGTNRKPEDRDDLNKGFTGERGDGISYGRCRIAIPKSHKIGSLGSGWWRRFLTGTDDRLKLIEHLNMAEAAYWSGIAAALASCPAGQRTALVFIHGFNTTFEQAALRAAQIGFDLKAPGITAFFSWPSKGTLAGYAADEATIEASEPYITAFLIAFAGRAEVERVHIIAHSMGNRVLLRAIHTIAEEASRATRKPFGQILLAAPDVDTDTFKTLAATYRQVAERTTLYTSSKDLALAASGIIHDHARAGFTPPVTVLEGIDTVDVSQVDLTLLGHGYFADQRPVLNDMHEVILHGESPERRLGLNAAQHRDGRYWTVGA